jgi:SAM-dependent methyltransferase
MRETAPDAQERTLADFGEQWGRYSDNAGFYGSLELFADVFGPLLEPRDVAGSRVADIGSGTGRIVRMLLAAGASHVTALEPSAAFSALEANTRAFADRVLCIRARGDQIPEQGFDLVVSVGVLHHVPQPRPVLEAAWRALRPGGRVAVWLYGREGNEVYLALVEPLRLVTTRLPHAALAALSWLLTAALGLYAGCCRFLPLPLRGYMRSVVSRLSWSKCYLTVYDQLNPAFARYYRRQEAIELVASAGFKDVEVYHRHGYSWAVTGRRPVDTLEATPARHEVGEQSPAR